MFTVLSLILAQTSPLVSVTGLAERVFVADQATVGAQAIATGKDLDATKRSAVALRGRLINATRKAYPGLKPIPIANLSVFPEYEGFVNVSSGGGIQPVKSYTVWASFEIAGVDLARTGAIVRSIEKMGGGGAAAFTYGIKGMKAARRALLREALDDAREKAEDAAEAAGYKLGEIALIEVVSAPTFTPQYDGGFAGSVPRLGVVAPRVSGRTSISVRFRLAGNGRKS